MITAAVPEFQIASQGMHGSGEHYLFNVLSTKIVTL